MKGLVQGIGINDANYVVKVEETLGYINGKQKRKLVWACPLYQLWMNMLQRCYSEKWKAKNPSYKGCSVCPEWLTFSNFKAWVEQQDYEGKQLDKDLLIPDSKLYSPDTCVFVSRQVNSFLLERGNDRGEYKIGVSRSDTNKKFKAACSNPFTGKQEYLGYFTREDEAHEAWLAKKLEHAYTLSALQTDGRVAKALVERYENYTKEESN